jgi:hypothetical protein
MGFEGATGAGLEMGLGATLGAGFAGVAGFGTVAGLAGAVERVSTTDFTQTVTEFELVCESYEKPPTPPAEQAQDGIGLNW